MKLSNTQTNTQGLAKKKCLFLNDFSHKNCEETFDSIALEITTQSSSCFSWEMEMQWKNPLEQ